MKKLLLFALCAFTLAACEPSSNTATTEGKLTLTSKSVMNFEALGGAGEITFDFVADETRQAAPVAVTCAEDWISDIEIGERKVTFNVAPNEGNERTAKIKLTHDQDNVHVMVIQAGGTPVGVKFTATHMGGTYYGKFIGGGGQTEGFNYHIIMSDAQPCLPNLSNGHTEYRFDIYAGEGSEFNRETRIPVGTYTFDPQGIGRIGTIDGSPSCSYLINANQSTSVFGNCTMVVSENSIIADVTLMNGETHRVEYYGAPIMEDYSEPTYADVYPVSQYTDTLSFDVTGGYMYAYFRGDWLGTGNDVWFMHMIEQKNGFSGVYLIFNFIVPKSVGGINNTEGYLGEYTLSDPTKSLDWTFPAGRLRDDSQQLNAYYLYCESGQIDMSKAAPIIDGTIKVEKIDGNTVITVDGKDDAGNDIKGRFSGEVRELEDQSTVLK